MAKRKHTAKRRRRFIGYVLMGMVMACVIAIVTTFTILCVKLTAEKNETMQEEKKEVSITEGLTQGIFLGNNRTNEIRTGNVQVDDEEQNWINNWQIQLDLSKNYHMQITEKESYGVNEKLYRVLPDGDAGYGVEEKELATTQTRKIDVYSTLDSEGEQWYIIQIVEQDFKHSSLYSVTPGVYFFKADGSSHVETIEGTIQGEEKEKLLQLLKTYLPQQYCNIKNIAGRTGDLKSVDSFFANDAVNLLLQCENGQVEIAAIDLQLTRISGNYTTEEGSESYEFLVEMTYGDTFSTEAVDILREKTYLYMNPAEEVQFWNETESQTISLADVNKVNTVWSQIVIPEEFEVRATIDETTTIVTNSRMQVGNQQIVNVQRQKVGEEIYTKLSVRYMRREFGVNTVEAGTYLFNEKFIWTDRGVLSAKDAPELLKALQGFCIETYFNVKWQLGFCGNLYLESYKEDYGYEINLIEREKKTSGYPNYAKIRIDEQNRVESFQTHIRYGKDKNSVTASDMRVDLSYEPKALEFSIPE